MDTPRWQIVALTSALAGAGCKDSLHCEDKGAVEQSGACTCAPGTRPDETGERCVPQDGGTPLGNDDAGPSLRNTSAASSDGGAAFTDAEAFNGAPGEGASASDPLDASAAAPEAAVQHSPMDFAQPALDGGNEPDRDSASPLASQSHDANVSAGPTPASRCTPGACAPGTCVESSDDYSCTCPPGYVAGHTCTDHDECAAGVNDCQGTIFECANLPGAYACLGRFADWPMPETGQVTPSYSGDDETLVDNVTGLTWQKALPETYAGCTGLHQESIITDTAAMPGEPPGTTCTWNEAFAYCESLNLGGSRDWRLPGGIEMLSLVHAYQFSGISTDQQFWLLNGHGSTYTVQVEPPHTMSQADDRTYYVRCVRGVGKNANREHYTVSDDGTEVIDNRTELTWQRYVNLSLPRTFADAQAYCQQSGRRLPTLKELYTLYDAQLSLGDGNQTTPNLAVDGVTFALDDTSWDDDYWSSTKTETLLMTAPDPGNTRYFTARVGDAGFSFAAMDERHLVRCVR